MPPSDIELKVIIMEQCNVCMEEFNELKTCGNSTKCNYKMCNKCLKKINEKLDKKCPQCRKVIDEETDQEIYEETDEEIDQETTESKCKRMFSKSLRLCGIYTVCGSCLVFNVVLGAGIISIWIPSFFSVLSLWKYENGCAALCLGSVTTGITLHCCYSADTRWNDRYGVSLFDENNSNCCCYKILKTYERSWDSQVAGQVVEEMER